MICFKRKKLIYIFLSLFLMVIISCEKKVDENIPPVTQEVITVKIPSIEKEKIQATSGTGIQATQGIKSSVDASPQPELKFNIDKTPTTEHSKPEAVPPQTLPASDISSGSKIASDSNKSTLEKIDSQKGSFAKIDSQKGSFAKSDSQKGSLANIDSQKTTLQAMTDTPENQTLLPLGDINGQISEEKLFYIPKGKINPFDPLIKEKPPVEQTQEVPEEDIPERILTPLEKLDFGQMKLVAILSRSSGSVAMVQEATGKGYIVNIGTYIGRNQGQVISIEKDKLVIQEKSKDYKGNVVDSFQELKLNKSDDKG